MEATDADMDYQRLPLKLPVELRVPRGFDPDDLSTWPQVDGRLEWVGGRLLFMPPCGARQSCVALNLAAMVRNWLETHPEFTGGTNEAGIRLGGDRRGADVAVWRFQKRPLPKGFMRVPPVLAIEVEGKEKPEREPALRAKARWYLKHDTKIVWLVLPSKREVVVVTKRGVSRYGSGEMTPEHPELPDLRESVDRLFAGI
ncbi:MAG TPA: Uma2 family endonuclease [Myxococcaceae bacterium]|nr:Uma2 family endonuclease [Myxococcaceae bacterium]